VNYRHHFHAGNFADVMKHALLVQLIRALQKKEKGFLYLDTHAGRGHYDLNAAAKGDTLARKPEWPEGIGRLWEGSGEGTPKTEVPEVVADYVALVREFNRSQGAESAAAPRFYPGSPWFARQLARPQDRLALCEKQPDEFTALREQFQFSPRTTVQEMDGYVALRAMLPPPERRGLVLIDPPFEAQNEFAQIGAALGEGLRRFPSGVFSVWYPLTERARVDAFFAEVFALKPPPTLIAELEIAGEQAGIKMRGCGLLVINPPWGFDRAVAPLLTFLGEALAQAPGARAKVSWLVPEK
jgi:23S rRNA (adenine2030-N6)-methyltransferase